MLFNPSIIDDIILCIVTVIIMEGFVDILVEYCQLDFWGTNLDGIY